MPSWASLLALLALQLLLTLLFIGQPVHLDDPIYIDIGRNALKVPAQALDFPYCLEGVCAPDMGSHSHPPLLGYYIGLLLLIFGDGPHVHVFLHLGFALFALLFAFGMYRLALRFAVAPAMAAATAIASPVVMVMSHNLMPDFPTLAFWTAGTAMYVDGIDRQRSAKVWLGGVLLALAAGVSYPALAAAAICLLYAWLRRTPMRTALPALLLPFATIAGWVTYASLYFGRFILGNTTHYFVATKGSVTAAALLSKALAFPIQLGGMLVLCLPLMVAAFISKRKIAPVTWVLISALMTQLFVPDYSLLQRFVVLSLLTAGGWTIFGALFRLWESVVRSPSPGMRRDSMFLAGWAAVVTPVVLFVYAYAAARFVLPLLPPLVLLAFSKAVWSGAESKVRRLALPGLAVSIALGLALSAADFEMARVHRDIARELGTALQGWQVRFGGEWGFRHYLLEQGFRQFAAASSDLSGGDFVIRPRQAVPSDLPLEIQTMLVPVGSRAWSSWLPVRVMNRLSHAGFYSSGWGLTPFAISRWPVEEITIEQVSYLVEKLPEITLESAPGLAAIPRPAAGGGVELVIPVPAKLHIPYAGPAARVQFACSIESTHAACPLQMRFEHDGHSTELNAEPGTSEAASFLLPPAASATIVMEVNGPADHAVITNWLILPAGGLP